MNEYRTDLHIHTVLSPCGDLEMSPTAIIREAIRKGLDIIGVSDHNTTRHARLMTELGKENGIFVLPGVEINTSEEVHCLAFFESLEITEEFQKFMDRYLPLTKNDPVKFGYQVELDREERIVFEEERLLFNAINRTLEETEQMVHDLNGLFIPAHIDRAKNSIMSQLGFMPEGLKPDAIEISRRSKVDDYLQEHPEFRKYTVITSSDAHYLPDIGIVHTRLRMKERSFGEIRDAFRKLNGREVMVP